jgi:hypothetical protein
MLLFLLLIVFELHYFVSRLLPFKQIIEVVFLLRKTDVVFHISSNWVRIRLFTKNQLPRWPGTVRIVITSVVVVVVVV